MKLNKYIKLQYPYKPIAVYKIEKINKLKIIPSFEGGTIIKPEEIYNIVETVDKLTKKYVNFYATYFIYYMSESKCNKFINNGYYILSNKIILNKEELVWFETIL